jgi:hypothetical protein
VALSAIQLPIIKKHLPKIIRAIEDAAPGSFQAVDLQPEEVIVSL